MSYISCAGPAHLLRSAANYSLNFTKDLKTLTSFTKLKRRILKAMVVESLLAIQVYSFLGPCRASEFIICKDSQSLIIIIFQKL